MRGEIKSGFEQNQLLPSVGLALTSNRIPQPKHLLGYLLLFKAQMRLPLF
jgi:hypothetical protein